jgi:hypothetical protein
MLENACQNLARMPKDTLLALMHDSPAGDFLEKIPYASWEILSFNPSKYEVCVQITSTNITAKINDEITSLRIELASAPDDITRRSLEQSIRTLLTKLNNIEKITISLDLSNFYLK